MLIVKKKTKLNQNRRKANSNLGRNAETLEIIIGVERNLINLIDMRNTKAKTSGLMEERFGNGANEWKKGF